jgi:hypothetical protein
MLLCTPIIGIRTRNLRLSLLARPSTRSLASDCDKPAGRVYSRPALFSYHGE